MKNCNYHIWYLTSRPASSIQVNPADWITWGQDMNFGEETLQRLFLRNILRRFSNYWSERRNRHWHVNKLRVNSYHLLGGLTWSLYFIRNWGQIVTFLGGKLSLCGPHLILVFHSVWVWAEATIWRPLDISFDLRDFPIWKRAWNFKNLLI